jgi:hypothetical protein
MAKLFDGYLGILPHDPDFPKVYANPITGDVRPLKDTPQSRAWVATLALFDDHAKRISFCKRAHAMWLMMMDERYAKYVDLDRCSFHVGFWAACATVPFNIATTPDALRDSFHATFERCLASTVNPCASNDDGLELAH